MLLKLAWRNIWRNKRRTLITLASVFFAVILSTLMMSIKEGMYDKMIEGMVGAYTGYAQVHADGYWEDRSLDNAFRFDDEIGTAIAGTKGLQGYVPRIEHFALAASEEVTKGAMVVGVQPEAEKAHTALHERLVEGTYFTEDDKAAMIGSGLAEKLRLGVGDTIVLLGQGYHGASAAGKYPVKGIVKFGSPELSKQLVFLPMAAAQWLYDMDGLYTSLVLLPDDIGKVSGPVERLQEQLGDAYEVMDWEELNPSLINMIETDRVEGYVFMFILYTVISFGLFGTMLMMLAERTREFGVLIAVGMRRMRLAVVVFLEVLMISIMGAFVGMAGAFPVCYYFYRNPIEFGEELTQMTEEYGMEAVLQASISPDVFVQQAAVVAFIAIVIAVYPFVKLIRMNVINAMRS